MSQENVEIVKRGFEVDARSHQVYSLLDGKLIRMDEYLMRDEALNAAGVRE